MLLGTHSAALIDTGLGIDNIKRVTDQLTSLPIKVLTTHVHWDHIGSHGQFTDIYVHEGDLNWLKHGIQGLSISQIRNDIRRDITSPVTETFNPDTYKPFQGEPAGLLEDREEIDLGNRQLMVYHTPGHSPGHICVFDKTNGYLFTGDLLYDQAPVYAFYPSTDPEALTASLEKIAGLRGVRQVFGSHHTLGLSPEILEEVKKACTYLRENDLAKFGTGIHQFNGFSVQF